MSNEMTEEDEELLKALDEQIKKEKTPKVKKAHPRLKKGFDIMVAGLKSAGTSTARAAFPSREEQEARWKHKEKEIEYLQRKTAYERNRVRLAKEQQNLHNFQNRNTRTSSPFAYQGYHTIGGPTGSMKPVGLMFKVPIFGAPVQTYTKKKKRR